MHFHLSSPDAKEIDTAPRGGCVHAAGVAEDQLVVLDDNVLRVSAGRATLLPLRVGPRVASYLHGLGATSIALGGRASTATLADRVLDFLVCDDLLSLTSELAALTNPRDRHDARNLQTRQLSLPHVGVACPPTARAVVFSGHQPGYFRSLSFFAKMAMSHIFCFADDMQFVRGEWQNRQRFPRPGDAGTSWLTVPLMSGRGLESIRSKRIANESNRRDWRVKHWRTLESVYSRTMYFARYAPFFLSLYQRNWRSLAALCEAITRFVALELGIATPLALSSNQVGFPAGLARGERIAAEIETLRRRLSVGIHAVYLSGAGAAYLDARRPSGLRERDFIECHGIQIRSCTVEPSIIAEETGLDPRSPAVAFLFHLGPHAGPIMKGAIRFQ